MVETCLSAIARRATAGDLKGDVAPGGWRVFPGVRTASRKREPYGGKRRAAALEGRTIEQIVRLNYRTICAIKPL